MTKFFKSNNKIPKATPRVPRTMEELNKAYSDLVGKLGMEELKLHITKKNTDFYKEQLVDINAEADARQKLDTETKESSEATK